MRSVIVCVLLLIAIVWAQSSPVCGDRTLTPPEACDDGNTVDGDGCSSRCELERGWQCSSGLCNVFSPICGDSLVVAPELGECEDGNSQSGDGCSDLCRIEFGWYLRAQVYPRCALTASAAVPICPTAGLAFSNQPWKGPFFFDDFPSAEPQAPCSNSASLNSPSGWFKYTPSASGTLRLEVRTDPSTLDCRIDDPCGSSCTYLYDSRLSVWDTQCPDTASCIASDDDSGCGYDSQISSLSVVAGVTYLIQIGAYPSSSSSVPPEGIYLKLSGPACAAGGSLLYAPRCGDGIRISPAEDCDDGNLVAGDGCSPSCRWEAGAPAGFWTCTTTVVPGIVDPTRCQPPCNDDIITTDSLGKPLECQDDNTVETDGCSNACVIQPGWAPSRTILPFGTCSAAAAAAATGSGSFLVCPAQGAVASAWLGPAVPGAVVETGTHTISSLFESAWFVYEPVASGTVTIETFSTQLNCGCNREPFMWINPALEVYKDSCGSVPVASDDDGSSCDFGRLEYYYYSSASGGGGPLLNGYDANSKRDYPCSGAPAAPQITNLAVVAGSTYYIRVGVSLAADPALTPSSFRVLLRLDANAPACAQPQPRVRLAPVCGDGIVVGEEQCDPGRTNNPAEWGVWDVEGEGCVFCHVSAGWSCSGEPSVCEPICGDGVQVSATECEDGNFVDGDGCSSNCTLEDGYELFSPISLLRPSCGSLSNAIFDMCPGTLLAYDMADQFRSAPPPSEFTACNMAEQLRSGWVRYRPASDGNVTIRALSTDPSKFGCSAPTCGQDVDLEVWTNSCPPMIRGVRPDFSVPPLSDLYVCDDCSACPTCSAPLPAPRPPIGYYYTAYYYDYLYNPPSGDGASSSGGSSSSTGGSGSSSSSGAYFPPPASDPIAGFPVPSISLVTPSSTCAGALAFDVGVEEFWIGVGTTAGKGRDAAAAPSASCRAGATASEQWFTFIGNGGLITLSMCNDTTYDSQLGLYSGSCGALVAVACNDDGAGIGGVCPLGSSLIVHQTVPGRRYYIQVFGSGTSEGQFELKVRNQFGADAPCDAIDWGTTPEFSVRGNLFQASDDWAQLTESCRSGFNDTYSLSVSLPDLWYRVVGRGGRLRVATCNVESGIDAFVGIFESPTDDCSNLVYVGYPGLWTCTYSTTQGVGCSDCACGGFAAAAASVSTEVGKSYWIQISGYDGAQGPFRVDVINSDAPAGDECVAAADFGFQPSWSTRDSTAGATFSALPLADAPCDGSTAGDVWYRFTTRGGPVIIQKCRGSSSPTVNVYRSTDDCATLETVWCGSTSCYQGFYVTRPGDVFYVQVQGAPAEFELSIQNYDPKTAFRVGFRKRDLPGSESEQYPNMMNYLDSTEWDRLPDDQITEWIDLDAMVASLDAEQESWLARLAARAQEREALAAEAADAVKEREQAHSAKPIDSIFGELEWLDDLVPSQMDRYSWLLRATEVQRNAAVRRQHQLEDRSHLSPSSPIAVEYCQAPEMAVNSPNGLASRSVERTETAALEDVIATGPGFSSAHRRDHVPSSPILMDVINAADERRFEDALADFNVPAWDAVLATVIDASTSDLHSSLAARYPPDLRCWQTQSYNPEIQMSVSAGNEYYIRIGFGCRKQNRGLDANPVWVTLDGPDCFPSADGIDGQVLPICGDGLLRAPEECDLGRPGTPLDGCVRCLVTPGFRCGTDEPTTCDRCGNGRRVAAAGEDCDDGNSISDDGCSTSCVIEPGWQCPNPGAPCVAAGCGDGYVRGFETCDDNNTLPGDGCSSTCQIEFGWVCPYNATLQQSVCWASRCGDAILARGEDCDDGNTRNADGCTSSCKLEPGYVCPFPGLSCVAARCGDGYTAFGESCDDGNVVSDDGCSADCAVTEFGYFCNTSLVPSVCAARCGDAYVAGGISGEECDDGNLLPFDGCGPDCAIELGYVCAGFLPSRCSFLCGDGLRALGEECDDGNRKFGDGCSGNCVIEGDTWRCSSVNVTSVCKPFSGSGVFMLGALDETLLLGAFASISPNDLIEDLSKLFDFDPHLFQFDSTVTQPRVRQTSNEQVLFRFAVSKAGSGRPTDLVARFNASLALFVASGGSAYQNSTELVMGQSSALLAARSFSIVAVDDTRSNGNKLKDGEIAAIVVMTLVCGAFLLLVLLVVAVVLPLIFIFAVWLPDRRRAKANALYAPPATSHTSAIKQLVDQISSSGWVINYEDLEILNPPIGQGAFGTVNRARYRGADVAVKTFSSDESGAEWMTEVQNNAVLHHPNIVTFIGACLEPQALVTEFCHHGSLSDLYKKRPHEMTEERMTRWVPELAAGMSYIHSRGIVHRDLKCGNALLDAHWTAKISDMGISREASTMEMTKAAGTVRWTAPEVLKGHAYGVQADVYSFAIMLWELWAREIPFSGVRFDADVEDFVCDGERPPLDRVAEMPRNMRKVMVMCWAPSPWERPTFNMLSECIKSTVDIDMDGLRVGLEKLAALREHQQTLAAQAAAAAAINPDALVTDVAELSNIGGAAAAELSQLGSKKGKKAARKGSAGAQALTGTRGGTNKTSGTNKTTATSAPSVQDEATRLANMVIAGPTAADVEAFMGRAPAASSAPPRRDSSALDPDARADLAAAAAIASER